ncbi:hypothetical protein [Plantactinospora veratri]
MDDLDDAAARDLLRPLDGKLDQPSTVEIAGLLRAGRRRLRRRRLLTGSGLAAVTAVVLLAVPIGLAAVPDGRSADPAPDHGAQPGPAPGDPASPDGSGTGSPPPPPTRCMPQRLPLPAGATSSQVFDGDPTGRYLVGVARDDRTARTWTLLWDRGAMTVLEPETTDPAQLLVNSAGVVAGDGVVVRDGRAVLVAWVYRDGRYVDLTDPDGGYVGDVMDLNERGDVLGGIRTLAYRGKPIGTKGGPPESPDVAEVPGSNPVVWGPEPSRIRPGCPSRSPGGTTPPGSTTTAPWSVASSTSGRRGRPGRRRGRRTVRPAPWHRHPDTPPPPAPSPSGAAGYSAGRRRPPAPSSTSCRPGGTRVPGRLRR